MQARVLVKSRHDFENIRILLLIKIQQYNNFAVESYENFAFSVFNFIKTFKNCILILYVSINILQVILEIGKRSQAVISFGCIVLKKSSL